MDEFGDVWDAVGPLPKEAFNQKNRVDGFFAAIVDHIDRVEKGNPIVDLAGLPQLLKQRALATVKKRLANPGSIRTNVELLLDNGDRIILLDD